MAFDPLGEQAFNDYLAYVRRPDVQVDAAPAHHAAAPGDAGLADTGAGRAGAETYRGAPIQTDDPGYHCPRGGPDDGGIRHVQATLDIPPDRGEGAALPGVEALARAMWEADQGRVRPGFETSDTWVGLADYGPGIRKEYISRAIAIRARLAARGSAPTSPAAPAQCPAADELQDKLLTALREIRACAADNRRLPHMLVREISALASSAVIAAETALAAPSSDRGGATDGWCAKLVEMGRGEVGGEERFRAVIVFEADKPPADMTWADVWAQPDVTIHRPTPRDGAQP